jgi:hypothetical protein
VASYYYLVATLPMLKYEDSAPFSCDEFLRLCKSNVNKNDYKIITEALSGNTASYKFVKNWHQFDTNVKKELAEQRSKKLNRKGDKYNNTNYKEFRIVEGVRAALAAKNAYEGELLLMKLCWKYLDEESTNHVFDLEGLLAFSIKLKLLERKSRFDKVEGNKEFKSLLNNLQSTMKSN